MVWPALAKANSLAGLAPYAGDDDTDYDSESTETDVEDEHTAFVAEVALLFKHLDRLKTSGVPKTPELLSSLRLLIVGSHMRRDVLHLDPFTVLDELKTTLASMSNGSMSRSLLPRVVDSKRVVHKNLGVRDRFACRICNPVLRKGPSVTDLQGDIH